MLTWSRWVRWYLTYIADGVVVRIDPIVVIANSILGTWDWGCPVHYLRACCDDMVGRSECEDLSKGFVSRSAYERHKCFEQVSDVHLSSDLPVCQYFHQRQYREDT